MNRLESEIKSLKLFDGIPSKRHNEIEEIIKNKIKETKQLILIETRNETININ